MPPENNQNKTEKTQLKGIRTLESDTSEAMKKGEVSLKTLYSKQQSKRKIKLPRKEKANFLNRRATLIIVITLIISVFFVSGVWFFFIKDKKATTSETEIPKPPKPVIPSQEEIILEASGLEHLTTQLKQRLKKVYNAGDLIYFPIKKTEAISESFLESKTFLNLISTKVPVFFSNFIEKNFFLGIINLEKNHPVLIFEIQKGQYNNTFAGMLKWEKNILQDLSFLINEQSLSSTSTISAFKDKIIKNQNVRAVEKDRGIIFLYSIFNGKYVIITDSEKVLGEIIDRFVFYSKN